MSGGRGIGVREGVGEISKNFREISRPGNLDRIGGSLSVRKMIL
jgi:hypothetical protein